MKELKRMNWHEWIETNELTWVDWNEWLDMTDLKWRNGNKWVMNEMNKCKWMSWTWMNWNEPFADLIFKKWSGTVSFWECLMQLLDKDLVDRWNEALAKVARTLCRPHGRPHLQKSGPRQSFFDDFYVKLSSCSSRVHTLSTSSSKSGPRSEALSFWRFLC